MKLRDLMIGEIRAALPSVEVNEGWTPGARGITLEWSYNPDSVFFQEAELAVDIWTDGPDSVEAESNLQAIIDRIEYRIFDTTDKGCVRVFGGPVLTVPEEEDVHHLSASFFIRCFRRDLALALES